ncbi:MAG: PIG-L family deacetylase [Clostridia bacterium]|nr:PIG-L family deacetylase [Clostridia bacterium]
MRRKSVFNGVIRWSIPFLCALLSLCFRFSHFHWQVLAGALCFAGAWLLFCAKRRPVRSRKIPLCVFLLLAVLLGLYALVGEGVYHTRYQAHDLDRNLFKGKKILVLAPHQDDEINLFGGLYEHFTADSEVYVAFSTNGDKVVTGDIRIREAAEALGHMGVDRDHIIFLGYGDTCAAWAGRHMYNHPGDQVVASFRGDTETYGAEGFTPYRQHTFTRDHLKADLRDLLLDLRPDAVFCIDYDYHHDHRALSLLFEEAMGEILAREGNDYTPAVFKGFGYSTAYLGAPDFYADNIRSTVPYAQEYPFPGDAYTDEAGGRVFYKGENNIYLWRDRIRFPLAECNLSRTLHASQLYDAMYAHRSQDVLYEAGANLRAILNGDKVFWPRDTSGLLYGAAVSVSSGDGGMLRDFKLIDSGDITDKERPPFENLWAPEAADSQKTATFTFPEETALDSIRLYDNPSLTDNVLRASILFSDGSEIACGPLAIGGSPTVLSFGEKRVTSFSVRILETEGERPGLTEVEAYLRADARAAVPEIIKLQDAEENFVYDYWMTEAPEVFSVYNALDAYDGGASRTYELKLLGGQCGITRVDGKSFSVSCEKGERAELALYAEGQSDPVDRITVRNPRWPERAWIALLTAAEKTEGFYTPREQLAYFRLTVTDFLEKHF